MDILLSLPGVQERGCCRLKELLSEECGWAWEGAVSSERVQMPSPSPALRCWDNGHVPLVPSQGQGFSLDKHGIACRSPTLATCGHLPRPSGPTVPSCSLSPSSKHAPRFARSQASQSGFHRPPCYPSGLGAAFGDQQWTAQQTSSSRPAPWQGNASHTPSCSAHLAPILITQSLNGIQSQPSIPALPPPAQDPSQAQKSQSWKGGSLEQPPVLGALC